MTQPTAVHHEFINDDDNKYNQPQNGKNAIVVIGNTGVGKSSLINLFSGNDVIIGHSVNSGTKQSQLFQDRNDRDRYWLDSQGANDSYGADDEEVLKDVLQTLYENQVYNVKIIWCVDSGDICKTGKDIRFQAKFIESFGGYAWKSCLIIKKKGEIKPKGNMNGVISVAKNIKYGDSRIFGFTYYDNKFDYDQNIDSVKDKALRIIMKTTKPTTKERHELLREFGYLTTEEIKTMVNTKLSQLPSIKLNFKKEKCVKCGVQGDKRYIYAPCHIALQKYHPQYTIQYHSGNVRWIHTSSTTSEERNYGSKYHPGYQEWKTFLGVEVYGTRKYSCCGASEDHDTWKWITGCTDSTYTAWYYPCCGCDSSSSGCTKEYSCCGGNGSSTGCCRKYECCNGGEYSEGCKTRCSNGSCQKPWGTGPGCIKTTK